MGWFGGGSMIDTVEQVRSSTQEMFLQQWVFSYIAMLPEDEIPKDEDRIGLTFDIGFKDSEPTETELTYPPSWAWNYTNQIDISLHRSSSDPHIAINPLNGLKTDWTIFPDETFFFVVEYPDGRIDSQLASNSEAYEYLKKYWNTLNHPDIGGYTNIIDDVEFNSERRLL